MSFLLGNTIFQEFNIGEWKKGTNFTIKTFIRILDAHELTFEEFFRDFEP